MGGRNEVSAREGIDTKKSIMKLAKTNFVEMRYQPERALTPSSFWEILDTLRPVEMRYQPERALTLVVEFIQILFIVCRRNEVSAREGIDTVTLIAYRSVRPFVEMRY